MVAIPSGYNNINWANGYTIAKYYYAVSGYNTGVVSGNQTSYNGGGSPMTMTNAISSFFTLHSAAAAASEYDNLQLTIVGYRSNVVIANNTFILQVLTVSYLTFSGYSQLDTAVFTTSGGTQNPNVTGSGTHFAMDNLCLSFTWMRRTSNLFPSIEHLFHWLFFVFENFIFNLILRK